KALFTKDCQPQPMRLNASTTSASNRTEIATSGFSAFGRPALAGRMTFNLRSTFQKLIVEISVDLFVCAIFGPAVPLLQFAREFLALAVNLGEVIVREVTPLLFHATLELGPLSFEDIGIHWTFSCFCWERVILPRRQGGPSALRRLDAQRPGSHRQRWYKSRA